MKRSYSTAEAKSLPDRAGPEAKMGRQARLNQQERPISAELRSTTFAQPGNVQRDFWTGYCQLRQRFDFQDLDIDPTEVFMRDGSVGGDFSWSERARVERRK